MRLTSTDGTEIELRPVRYQFPATVGSEPGEWDANWLVVRGRVRLADGQHWRFEDACMTTWEAEALARWLRRVAADEVIASPFPAGEGHLLAFTEPNLAFSLAETRDEFRTIRVHFSFEASPPWEPEPYAEVNAFFVPLTTTVPELASALGEWDRERAVFPPR